MRRVQTCVLLVALTLVGCFAPRIEEALAPTREPGADAPFPPAPQAVRFLAFGDYGFGNDAQNQTARAMRDVCAREGCDMALLLGDHYYPQTPLNASHAKISRIVYEPYANLSIPLYAVLGNHDARTDHGAPLLAFANTSEDWRMPDRSYAFREGDVFFIALDMTSFYPDETLDENGTRLATWLDEVMASEDYLAARWRVAFSHFPYASNGLHGSAGEYDGRDGSGRAVAQLVESRVCGKFDLYLAGHDHSLEWLAPRPECEGTELIVSGAGAEARGLEEDALPARFQHDESPGFFWFEAEGASLLVRAFDDEARLLYERAVTGGAWEAASSLRPPRAAP